MRLVLSSSEPSSPAFTVHPMICLQTRFPLLLFLLTTSPPTHTPCLQT